MASCEFHCYIGDHVHRMSHGRGTLPTHPLHCGSGRPRDRMAIRTVTASLRNVASVDMAPLLWLLHLLLLSTSAWAINPSPLPLLSCSSDADCNYNGVCSEGGQCQCEPQFKGTTCGVFNFVPLDLNQGTGLRTIDTTNGEQVSSWGGSVHLADDGRYHMWAAEMTNGVGIKAWITNSQVVHAVADEPQKPQRFNRKVSHRDAD